MFMNIFLKDLKNYVNDFLRKRNGDHLKYLNQLV